MTLSGESLLTGEQVKDAVGGRAVTADRLEIGPLLHPYEASRFLLAVVSSGLVLGGAAILLAREGIEVLMGAAIGAGAVALAIWATLQLVRARLLGRAVRVSAESMPGLQAAVEEVRRRLDYHRRVDVYVIDKASESAMLTTFLGTRIILLEGDFAAALQKPERRGQLVFLLASFFGALKAKHQRMDPVLVLLSMFNSLKLLKPLLAPYLRATRYSGDQIGYACCGDFSAAMGTLNRLLVGQDLAPEVAPKGVLDQATVVRHRLLPRLAQLFSDEPHLTNRYLNMLFFADVEQPEAVRNFRRGLDPATDAHLEAALRHAPHRRSR